MKSPAAVDAKRGPSNSGIHARHLRPDSLRGGSLVIGLDFLYRPGQSRDQHARAATAEPCPRAAARAGWLSGGVILPPLAVDPCDSRPHNPAVLPDGVLRPWTG